MSPSTHTVHSTRPSRPSRDLPPSPLPDTNNTHILPNSTLTDEPQFEPHAASETDLTPLRAHYLKKSLIQLQFSKELDLITSADTPNVSTLSYLGPPFTPPPKGVAPLDLPFLKYIFRQFVVTFPFMEAAPKDFYSQKVQPFVGAMLSRNLSNSSMLDDGATEQATRKKLLAKAERNMAMFVGSATKLMEREDVVRLTQTDLDKLEKLAEKRQKKMAKNKDHFEVNIVGVRTVTDKGRMRSRVHQEFIIRTRRSHHHDVYVSRRYGDFRTLADELAKHHPEENIRPPPAKDRSTVAAPSTTSPGSQMPLSPASAFSRQSWDSYDVMSPNYDNPNGNPSPNPRPSRLAREKNRLTLRSYLHSLLSSYTVASSPVLKSFLLSSPTTLSLEELEDAKHREEADSVRDDGRKRFAKEIAARVDGLRDAVKSVKGDIMGKDGLTHVFGTIKVTPNIQDLPENYQAVTEWARISLASTVFHTFVASDDASETFAGLKRIHGLMPYFMLKGALKITNPIGMIRTVLDLFLAQPFGGRSLLQRMFTSSLTEEVRVIEEEIDAVKDKIDDPVMCHKIRQFVYAPREIQELFKLDAASEQMNVLTIVLRSSEEPTLSRVQMHRLARAHRAHAIYLKHRDSLEDSDDDDGPQDEDAWLLEDLKVLTHLYQRLRDREQLIALIFEGFTAELLKDIITIFYSPLAQVYRAASIADSLSDMQNFINDLIKTVEQVEELSQEDPHRTVQAFIDLIQRHEQSFYNFVHKVHSKGEGLFDSLMRWIELFLTVMREGLGAPISLEFLLPHTGKERSDILAEVDKVALYHYKLKVIYEDKLRRRFVQAQDSVKGGQDNDADAEDEATQLLINGVIGEFNFGDLVQGDALDLAAEETDEEEDDSSYDDESTSSGSETDTSSDESEDDSQENAELKGTTEKAKATQPSPPPTLKKPFPSQVRQSSQASSSRTSVASTPAPPKRSLSLRSTRSMTFSRNGISFGKKGQETPPVPQLPSPSKSAQPVLASHPLASSSSSSISSTQPPQRNHEPLLPSSSSQTQIQASPQQPSHPQPPTLKPSQKMEKKKKAQGELLKPPELEHIPQLLPVFLEMMRPLLRPRQRTTQT